MAGDIKYNKIVKDIEPFRSPQEIFLNEKNNTKMVSMATFDRNKIGNSICGNLELSI